jgi:hypothetical protein
MIILNYKNNGDVDGRGKWVLLFALVILAAGAAVKASLSDCEVDKVCINNEYYYANGGEIFKDKEFTGYSCVNDEIKIKSRN